MNEGGGVQQVGVIENQLLQSVNQLLSKWQLQPLGQDEFETTLKLTALAKKLWIVPANIDQDLILVKTKFYKKYVLDLLSKTTRDFEYFPNLLQWIALAKSEWIECSEYEERVNSWDFIKQQIAHLLDDVAWDNSIDIFDLRKMDDYVWVASKIWIDICSYENRIQDFRLLGCWSGILFCIHQIETVGKWMEVYDLFLAYNHYASTHKLKLTFNTNTDSLLARAKWNEIKKFLYKNSHDWYIKAIMA